MSQQLIAHSPDLQQLRNEGYEIEVKGGYLVIHHIPFVNNQKEIKYGILVSTLNLANSSMTAMPETHVIHFCGEHPCHKDGTRMVQIQNESRQQQLANGLIIDHTFSNKPDNGYINYFEKVKRYVDMISAPAISLDKNVTAKTFRVLENDDIESVFQYPDTNSSRAKINVINSVFNEQKIAIIGLGGTGAYILDLIAKTPVKEIHLFDGDVFLQHNAFRSPGAVDFAKLDLNISKTAYYSEIYTKMHRHVFSHSCYIDEASVDLLDSMSHVFICVDKDFARKLIIDHLQKRGIQFIDVGMGVQVAEDKLIGTLRVTTGTLEKNDHLHKRISYGDDAANEYATNIQIADLNSLNAVLAVMKWKKMCGFYQDLRNEHHSTYSINVAQLLNEDTITPVC